MKTVATELVETGEKKDAYGRRLINAEERSAILAAYERSGLTQRAFAQREGVKYCTFVTWLARHRRGQNAAHQQSGFAEVQLALPKSGWMAEVVFPNGILLRYNDPRAAADIINTLRPC